MKKWKVMAGALSVCCVATLTAGTLAYFTAEDRAHNVITTGNVEVELQELTDQLDDQGNPVPFEKVDDVMPGAEVSKIAQVKNTGSNPAWVRVEVDKAIVLAEGVDGEPDAELVVLDYNTGNWTESEGYYYYNDALEPGETTEPLFTTVTFSGDMDNLYKDSTVEIDVQVSAVQSENNGTSVLQAAGWPETE